MENRNVFWGVLLVAIGGLFILNNMDILDFSFKALIGLWPLLLVGWGISILPLKSVYKTTASIVIIIAALVYASTSDRDFWWENHNFKSFKHGNIHFNTSDDDEENSEKDETYYSFEFDEEMDSNITEAKLEMDVAAGKFRIDESVNEHLIAFDAYSNIGPYNSNMVTNDNKAEIFISMEDAIIKNGTNRNRATIKLNPDVVWDLNFDIGAADFRGDFRKFKVANIDIDGGASSIKIKLGELQKETYINIDAAATSMKIDIPEKAGCKIESKSFLVDLNIDGFNKNPDGEYVSENYDESEQKIYIEIDAAISHLEVRRY